MTLEVSLLKLKVLEGGFSYDGGGRRRLLSFFLWSASITAYFWRVMVTTAYLYGSNHLGWMSTLCKSKAEVVIDVAVCL